MYNLVTVRMHHNGVVLRESKQGKLIGSNMYRVKPGQFVLSGIDARNGAFGIIPEELDGAVVTNDFWYFDIDEKVVSRDFFLWLTTTPLFLDACVNSSEGTTNRRRLQSDKFFNFEFYFPDIDEQRRLAEHFIAFDTTYSSLKGEFDRQCDYFKQLRQAVLQEAVDGKLTVEWRRQHPVVKGDPNFDAVALLKSVELHWETNKRKYKGLSLKGLISGQVFEPHGTWVKTNIDSFGIVKVGSTPARTNLSYWNGDFNWVSSGEVANNIISITKECITSKALDETSLYICPMGTVLLAMIGQGKTRGQTAILNIEAATNQNVAAVIIDHGYVSSKFLWYFFLSQYMQTRSVASGGNQAALNSTKVGNFSILLPPLAEQQAIVARVDSLMASIDELEKLVAERKDQAQMLMHTVLREAFDGGLEVGVCTD